MLRRIVSSQLFESLRTRLNVGYVANAEVFDIHRRRGLVLVVQSERLRPDRIEAEVEDALQKVLSLVKKMRKSAFLRLLSVAIQDLSRFEESWTGVVEKVYEEMEEKLTFGSVEELRFIRRGLSLEAFVSLAESVLRLKQKRVTLELFAKEVSEQEQKYVLNPAMSLTQRVYRIVSLEHVFNLEDEESNKPK